MADYVSILPPSPVPSDYDSLAGIDDLDAFLESKGVLSQFPTPPLKSKDVVHVAQLEVLSDIDDDQSDDEVDELDIATVFARELTADGLPIWDDILMVESMLIHVHLPIEIIALAFNILRRLNSMPLENDTLASSCIDLLITSSLSLASVYLNDHPPPYSYWAKHFCNGQYTARHINATVLAMLEAMSWHMLEPSSPLSIRATICRFERRSEQPVLETCSAPIIANQPSLPHPLQLALKIDSTSGGACWSNGQLTPGTSPPVSAVERVENTFLPLL